MENATKKQWVISIMILMAIVMMTFAGCSSEIAHTHTYSEAWTYDEDYHWHKATCEHTSEISGKEAHAFVDGLCSVCGYKKRNQDSDDPSNPVEPEKVFKTVSFDLNGGNGSLDDMQFEVGEVMSKLPTPTLSGYNFICWEEYPFGEEYTAASIMPNRDLSLRAKWEKIILGYSDNYVSFKPSSEGVKDSTIRELYRDEVDKFVYVEITSDDLGGVNNVGKQNNFNLRTLEGMQYSVKSGYNWTWYQGNFETPNGAQRFTLDYGSNIQFVTISDNSGVVQQTYLLDIYVKHDYYISLYKNIFDNEPYDRIRVIENERFAADTPAYQSSKFEFDSRVYYNSEKMSYEKFVYSIAITKNWSLYQTYKPYTITADLDEGNLDEELIIVPYTKYFTLPSAEKEGYDFLGWKLENDEYLTNVQGYSGEKYLSEENCPKKLSAVYSEKVYYYTFDGNTLRTIKTVPVVTYTDSSMTEILDIVYTPYDTDCVLPTSVPVTSGKIFKRWQQYYQNDRGEFSQYLSDYEFDSKIKTPLALIPEMENTSSSVISLNRENTFNSRTTYTMYLPVAQTYSLKVATTGSITFKISLQEGNKQGEYTYTASSSSPKTVSLRCYVYNLGSQVTTSGYVTMTVTNLSGTFTAELIGDTAKSSGTPVVPNDSNTAKIGAEFTVSLSKAGYSFAGWYEDEVKVTDSEFLKMEDAENTYTAKWVTCPVTLEKSIAEAGTVGGIPETTTIGQEVTITASTKNGYTWVGWYNGETELTKEQSYKFDIPLENVTYTAKWIKVTIARNNTSAGSVSSLNTTYKVGDEVTVTASTSNGYTWVGWFNGETELTKELSYTFNMPSENVIYTAKWARLTLSRNNTSAGTISSLSSKYVAGQEATVKASTNSGYTWLGWYNDEKELTKELSYTFAMPSEDMTYTATWAAYTITTRSDNTAAGTVTTKNSVMTAAGTEVKIVATTKSGYTFMGWYEGDTLLCISEDYTFIMPEKSITYTAKWILCPLNVSKNIPNAGDVSGIPDTSVIGQSVLLKSSTKAGYTWRGWYEGEKLITTETTLSISLVAELKNYTAMWDCYTVDIDHTSGGDISLERASVSFDLNGGESEVPATQIITESNNLKYPQTIPTRRGYAFTGWYTEPSCISLFDFSKNITQDIVLYAGWQVMETNSYKADYVDFIENYNTSSNAYSFSNEGTSNSLKRFTYFTVLKDGQITLYYKNGSSSSSYGTYIYVYNVTQNAVIKSNSACTSTSYASVTITANAGDIIFIRNYRSNTNYKTNFYMYIVGLQKPVEGGSLIDSISQVNVTAGTEISVIASTVDGYTFSGWYNENLLLSKELKYTFIMPNSNVHFTAKWIPCPLSIESENSEAGSVDMPPTTILGDEVTIYATTNEGYTFVGWYNGDTLLTTEEEYTFTLSLNEVKYTAKWTYYTLTISSPQGGYISGLSRSVSFNLNGAEGEIPQTQIITSEQKLEYPLVPLREGYVFRGWYTESDCVNLFDFSSVITEDLVLYAGWYAVNVTANKINIIDVFNNYNTSTNAFITSQGSATETKPNYVYFTALFSGKYTVNVKTEKSSAYSAYVSIYNATKNVQVKANSTTTCAFNGYELNATAGDIIYVKYYPYSKYTSSLYLCVETPDIIQNGYVGGYSSVKVTAGDNVKIRAEGRPGYTFIGWYENDNLISSDRDFEFNMPKANISYQARWVPCLIDLSVNDSLAGYITGMPEITEINQEITLLANTRMGYTFDGWYIGETLVSSNEEYNIKITNESKTYTAKWVRYKLTVSETEGGYSGLHCSVSFDLNGGEGDAPAAQIITKHEGLVYPTPPTKSGYVFTGWYRESECINIYDFSSTVTESMILYAGWYKMESTGRNIAIIDVGKYNSRSNRYSISTTNSNSCAPINLYFVLSKENNYTLSLSQEYSGTFRNLILYVENMTTQTVILDNYDSYSGTSVQFAAGASEIIRIRVYQKYGYNAGGSSGTTNTFKFYLTGFEYPADGGCLGDYIYVSAEENITIGAETENGYTFLGWYDGLNLLSNNEEYSFNMLKNDVSYTAKWTYYTLTSNYSEGGNSQSYNVEFNLNGGTGTAPATQTISASKALTYPTIPSRSGYVFTGWYTDASCKNLFDFSAVLKDNYTLYAGWYEITTTSASSNAIIDITSNYNTEAKAYKISTSNSSSTVNYVYFAALKGGEYTLYYKKYIDYHRVIIYNETQGVEIACITDNSSNYISFIFTANAGDVISMKATQSGAGISSTSFYFYFSNATKPNVGGKVNYSSTKITAGEQITLTAISQNGYRFLGWYEGELLLSTDLVYTFIMPNKNVVYEAKWEKLS